MKNQNFSVPLVFKEKNGQGIVENKVLPPSRKFYISIPGIEKDRNKVVNLLMASAAFPGAFPQRKLEYSYKDKTYSHYFIDGGLYDNVPLDLAIALNKKAEHFFFMDPSNMRKETVTADEEEDEEEQMPVGFISTNLIPVFSSFDIMQSMKLYNTINENFGEGSGKELTLSSRFHPLTGKYLAHFGAFLDINFRVYDYYVGVYDAIYHIAAGIKKHQYAHLSQIKIMNHLKTFLGLDKNPEALAAYTLFLNTEFHHLKPKTTDRFSAIYNAFNLKKPEAKRYDNAEFKTFLSKLDMKYLEQAENSIIVHAQSDIDNWYKKPTRALIKRVTTLENDRAKAGLPNSFATVTSVAAWAASDLTKEKKGFEFIPLNAPNDKGKEGLRTALRFIPGDIATDVKNGGLSFGYYARYYNDMGIIDGIEGKLSYVNNDDISAFLRLDADAFIAYSDTLNFGFGVSVFGDLEGSFYKQDTAYGVNTYVDVLDIFRVTYVHRGGDSGMDNYIYFGIQNIPSLIYWLNR